MTQKEKLALLEELMDLEEGDLRADMYLEEIGEYDSIAKLGLIVLMSDEFSKKLTAEQIKSFVTVKDILNYME